MLLRRWSLALLMMAVIFAFSSIPSSKMPDFYWADLLVKKSGHIIVFSLLALAYWYAMGWNQRFLWLAWLLAFLYAIFDEVHQSFVPGRHPWWVDIAIDSMAAAFALGIAAWYRGRGQKID
jgi:VanZ family protein